VRFDFIQFVAFHYLSALLVADTAAVAQFMVPVAALHPRRAGNCFNRMADQAISEQRNRVTGYLGVPDGRMTEETFIGVAKLRIGWGSGKNNLRTDQQMMFVDIGFPQQRKLNEIVMAATAIRFRGQAVAAGYPAASHPAAACPAYRTGEEMEYCQ